MSETYQRQSPLAHRGIAARAATRDAATHETAGLFLAEKPYRTLISVRGNHADAGFAATVKGQCGLAPSADANRFTSAPGDARLLLWLGPDEWLLVAEPECGAPLAADLSSSFRQAGLAAAAIDVSDGSTIIRLSGSRVRDVLAKGCTIDLHATAFAAGQCAQTLLAKADVTLVALGDGIELIVRRSFVDYLWRWLEDAGLEYGCVTLPDDF